MADPTTRDLLDRLATLEGTVQQQGVRLARYERRDRRGRTTRRLLPLLMAALLVALVPLATLAANPFNDLTGGVHDPNIDAIYNAGITTGCDPDVSYCPTENVTREEMASFLARTAGLGGNPPVANAKTAQMASNAASAEYAVNATNAQYAVSATDAANAATLGGYAPSALNRVAFSAEPLATTLPNTGGVVDIARVTLTIPGPAPQAVAVRGAFNAYGQASGGSIATSIRQDGAGAVGRLLVPYQVNSLAIGTSARAEWVFVAAPGTHTFFLAVQALGTTGSLLLDGHRLVATAHPFGATGTPGATEIVPAPPGGGGRPLP